MGGLHRERTSGKKPASEDRFFADLRKCKKEWETALPTVLPDDSGRRFLTVVYGIIRERERCNPKIFDEHSTLKSMNIDLVRHIYIVCLALLITRLAAGATVTATDTIASLRLLATPSPGDRVKVTGYYAANDGGGATYYWSASSQYFAVNTVTVGAAGTGYHVGDVLVISGGTAISATVVQVTAISGGGTTGPISAVVPFAGSSYSTLPSGTQTSSYFPDTSGGGSGATFSVSYGPPAIGPSMPFDDGGTVINPTSNTTGAAGRWVNFDVETKPNRLNALQYGAKRDSLFGGTFDSLPYINTAIAALPNVDYGAFSYPGAGHTAHHKSGSIYLPTGPFNTGYLISDEILISADMEMYGDTNLTAVEFLNGAAPVAGTEKFVVRVLVNGSSNETFNVSVHDLIINPNSILPTGGTALNNPGGSGLSFTGCNGSTFYNLTTGDVALRGFVVYSAGIAARNVKTGHTWQGPGLQVDGQQFTCDYADIEHVNSYTEFGGQIPPGKGPGNEFYYDRAGDPVAAVLFDGASSCVVDLITSEASPLPLKINASQSIHISSVETNSDTITTAATNSVLARIYNSDSVDVEKFGNQNASAQFVHAIHDTNTIYPIYDLYYDGLVYKRGSYRQSLMVQTLTSPNITSSAYINAPGLTYSGSKQVDRSFVTTRL